MDVFGRVKGVQNVEEKGICRVFPLRPWRATQPWGHVWLLVLLLAAPRLPRRSTFSMTKLSGNRATKQHIKQF